MQMLSASQACSALGIDLPTLHAEEKSRRLFSFSRPSRSNEREYPAFQGWPQIRGDRLTELLADLSHHGTADGADAYGFFLGTSDLLAGLAPVEVLVGRCLDGRAMAPDASTLISMSPHDRFIAVKAAARAFSATRFCW